MQITKKEVIQKIYDIEEKENLSLGSEVQRVVRSKVIPSDIIIMINKYDKEFLQIYDTYNTIYLSRYKNPLYRNLRNEHISDEECVIALSSLVTKILISRKKIEDIQEKIIFSKVMCIDELNKAITLYSQYEDNEMLRDCARQVRELLEMLYVD